MFYFMPISSYTVLLSQISVTVTCCSPLTVVFTMAMEVLCYAHVITITCTIML